MVLRVTQYPDKCSICRRDVDVKPLNMLGKDGESIYWGCALCDECFNSIQNLEKSEYILKNFDGEFYKLEINQNKNI